MGVRFPYHSCIGSASSIPCYGGDGAVEDAFLDIFLSEQRYAGIIFKIDLIVVKVGLLALSFSSHLSLRSLPDSFRFFVWATALGQFACTNVAPCFPLGRALLGDNIFVGVSIMQVEQKFQVCTRGVLNMVKSKGLGVS